MTENGQEDDLKGKIKILLLEEESKEQNSVFVNNRYSKAGTVLCVSSPPQHLSCNLQYI